MSTIRHFALLLAAIMLTASVQAQVINGDLNHNDNLDVEDVTLLIDGYLTGTTEQIPMGGEPYGIDNSLVAGKWYKSSTESVTFNMDGTTDYATGYTYEFMPTQGYIVFYDATGAPVEALYVLKATSDCLIFLPAGSKTPVLYTATQPVSISLSETSLEMKPTEIIHLTATVIPSDAGIVTWSSSDEDVATVESGYVTAIADGTAIITAEVAGCTATCTVTVIKRTYNNGYEYVDLGLPSGLKWATMNVGATTPEGNGRFFAWGETGTKGTYNWNTYKHCNGSNNSLTKYCTSSSYGTVDNKSVLDSEDDAAHHNWGGTWRMPTYTEWNDLKTKCTWEWTTQNGVNGYKVTGPNGKSIFLPAAGCRNDSSITNAGSYGYYWSSSLDTPSPNNAWYVYFYSSNVNWYNYYRYYGFSVRAVCP